MKTTIKIPSNQEIAEIKENKMLSRKVQDDLITLHKVVYSLKTIAMDGLQSFTELLKSLSSISVEDENGDKIEAGIDLDVLVTRIDIDTPHTINPDSEYVTEQVKKVLTDANGERSVDDIPELNQAFIVTISAIDNTATSEEDGNFYYVYVVGVSMDGTRTVLGSV